jgi:hypothetical protein
VSGFDPLAGSPLGALLASLSGDDASAGAEFYEELRDGFAKDMVEQFNTGAVVLIKASAVRGADPHNAFADEDAALRTARNAIVTGFPTAEITGAVLGSDRRVLLDAAGFTTANAPAGDDSIEIDGKLHAIMSLKAVPAAGPPVIYIIQART